LVLIGNGEIEAGRQLADSLGIASSVEFPGWVDHRAKEQWFSEASVFCLPSYAEGFPMAVLDAWAYRLPVVCTPVGGILDVLEDGKNGLLFDPGNVDKLVVQLDRLISNPRLRESIATESHTLSKTVFNLQHINKQLDDLYKELLGE
jgi:glycosyltransferase involved in cell wall biosynthesis